MTPRLLLCACLLLAGCATRSVQPQADTEAQAVALAECQEDAIRARFGDGPSFANRTGQATSIASAILAPGPLTEQNAILKFVTAPIALAAGVTAAAVGAGLDSAGRTAEIERATADCARARHAPPPTPAAEPPPPPVRNGAAELRALGVEPPQH